MRKQPLFSFGVKIIQDTSKTRGYYGGRGGTAKLNWATLAVELSTVPKLLSQ